MRWSVVKSVDWPASVRNGTVLIDIYGTVSTEDLARTSVPLAGSTRFSAEVANPRGMRVCLRNRRSLVRIKSGALRAGPFRAPSGAIPLLASVDPGSQQRDWEAERAEILAVAAISARPAESESMRFSDRVGRVPMGPARGWRAREQKAKSCELCEGDLWVEVADGSQQPCKCRQRRADRRARNRLRAGNWWYGTSLSFAAPPLARISEETAGQIHRLCDDIGQGRPSSGLWLVGDHGQGKSAICAYLGQRLYPAGKVAVEHLGDLMAHLRWLGAVKGEGAVETKLEELAEVPLLVIDDLDRPIRTFPTVAPLAMRESLGARDLIRLVTLLDERSSSLRPLVVTSRVEPRHCAERTTAISSADLLRGLVATAAGVGDPFEDFSDYTLAFAAKAFGQLQDACRSCQLSSEPSLGEVA